MAIDEMPEQPRTQKLTTPDETQVLVSELKVLVRGLRDDMQSFKSDVEERLRANEERFKLNSMRAQGISKIDMDQDARLAKTMNEVVQERVARETQIAQEQAARGALANDLAGVKSDVADVKKVIDVMFKILERLDEFTKNKSVKVIVFALSVAAASYLGSKGLK